MEKPRNKAKGGSGFHLDRLMLEAWRRAGAMGLVHDQPPDQAALQALRTLATALANAGLATSVLAALRTKDEVSSDTQVRMLDTIIDALETSPLPSHEWKGATTVLDDDALAALLDISVSSLARYRSGERDTPDPIAARLHFLTLLIADIAGSYSAPGIRRWFERPRTPLEGAAPRAWLRADWDPDQPRPQAVRKLARDLVFLSAT